MQEFKVGDTVYLKQNEEDVFGDVPANTKVVIEPFDKNDGFHPDGYFVRYGDEEMDYVFVYTEDLSPVPLSGLVSDLEFEYGNG